MARYTLLPFRYSRWNEREVFLSNEVGQYSIIPARVFSSLVSGELSPIDTVYAELKAKHFIFDSNSTLPLELLATKYRTKKSFLSGFTKLHYFVVTLRCTNRCRYCQVSSGSPSNTCLDMSRDTAIRAVDLMFGSPSPVLKVEFQGGEPLLRFDMVRSIVEYANERNRTEQRTLEFVVATNLSVITDEMLQFFKQHDVQVSTSLDGPDFIHNANRPAIGFDSYGVTVANLRKAQESLGPERVSALMTTTSASLGHPGAIVEEYIQQGFDCIFLRSVSPYGRAQTSGEADEYGFSEFVTFYKRALDYIIEVNRRGTAFVEVYTQILLQKILTPFPTGFVDLQSPAGVGIGAVAYHYDGSVYPSDEARMLAEMGDTSFCLGNVNAHSYEEIFGGSLLRRLIELSCLEVLPGCAYCAFLPYCGADPVRNWTRHHDVVGHRPTSHLCRMNLAIIRHLVELLRSEDEFVTSLFARWAAGRPVDARGDAKEAESC